MKREIKFRGKRIDNGEWVYGYLFLTTKVTVGTIGLAPCIQVISDNYIYYVTYEVDHETIGQFTGFTDKNGDEIYEGDNVHIAWYGIMTVAFVDSSWAFINGSSIEYFNEVDLWADVGKISGNIHDKPNT